MKARYTKLPDKRTREIYDREVDKMQKNFAVLFEKLFIYTLHTQFGIGEVRLKRWIEAITDSVDDMHNDPVFWDRVDRDVIDTLHFDYPKCNYEFMEKVFHKPPEISAADKRSAVADFRKMQEFLSQEGQT